MMEPTITDKLLDIEARIEALIADGDPTGKLAEALAEVQALIRESTN